MVGECDWKVAMNGDMQANGYGSESECSGRWMDQSNEKWNVRVCVNNQWCDAKGKGVEKEWNDDGKGSGWIV